MSSRNKQIAIVAVGVVALAVAVYVFGLPERKPVQEARTSLGETGAAAVQAPPPSSPAPASGARDAPTSEAIPSPDKTGREAGPQPPAVRQEGAQAASPAFDVVRVEPSGEAVIAGRAAPGATVELLRDGEQHDRVVADTSGLFAMTPTPLPPGTHELTLRFTTPDGRQALSKQSVTVVIAPDRKQQPVVALTAPDAPTVVLSKPETPAKPGTQAEQRLAVAPEVPADRPPAGQAAPPAGPGRAEPAERRPVSIEAVEADDGGRLFVSGRAATGATVRLYLNDSYLASGTAAGEGRVSFTIGSGVKPGDYRVRLDDVDPVSGTVRSRAEVLFNMPATAVALRPGVPAAGGETSRDKAGGSRGGLEAGPTAGGAPGARVAAPATGADPSNVLVPGVKTATVVRGDSLWRISRRVYGHGIRYTVIYEANQQQIRNPALIYPGQVFVLPGEPH